MASFVDVPNWSKMDIRAESFTKGSTSFYLRTRLPDTSFVTVPNWERIDFREGVRFSLRKVIVYNRTRLDGVFGDVDAYKKMDFVSGVRLSTVVSDPITTIEMSVETSPLSEPTYPTITGEVTGASAYIFNGLVSPVVDVDVSTSSVSIVDGVYRFRPRGRIPYAEEDLKVVIKDPIVIT